MSSQTRRPALFSRVSDMDRFACNGELNDEFANFTVGLACNPSGVHSSDFTARPCHGARAEANGGRKQTLRHAQVDRRARVSALLLNLLAAQERGIAVRTLGVGRS